VDASFELRVGEQLGQKPAQGPVEVERGP
jgi:hypothetical protein